MSLTEPSEDAQPHPSRDGPRPSPEQAARGPVPCSRRRDSDLLAASTSDSGQRSPRRHHCRGVTEPSLGSLAFDDTYNLEGDTV